MPFEVFHENKTTTKNNNNKKQYLNHYCCKNLLPKHVWSIVCVCVCLRVEQKQKIRQSRRIFINKLDSPFFIRYIFLFGVLCKWTNNFPIFYHPKEKKSKLIDFYYPTNNTHTHILIQCKSLLLGVKVGRKKATREIYDFHFTLTENSLVRVC